MTEYPDAEPVLRTEALQLKQQLIWNETKVNNTIAAYSTFLKEYKDSEYSAEARRSLQHLLKERKLRLLSGSGKTADGELKDGCDWAKNAQYTVLLSLSKSVLFEGQDSFNFKLTDKEPLNPNALSGSIPEPKLYPANPDTAINYLEAKLFGLTKDDGNFVLSSKEGNDEGFLLKWKAEKASKPYMTLYVPWPEFAKEVPEQGSNFVRSTALSTAILCVSDRDLASISKTTENQSNSDVKNSALALHEAVVAGDLELVKILITGGIDVNYVIDDNTPLGTAIKEDHFAIAELLMNAGSVTGDLTEDRMDCEWIFEINEQGNLRITGACPENVSKEDIATHRAILKCLIDAERQELISGKAQTRTLLNGRWAGGWSIDFHGKEHRTQAWQKRCVPYGQ